jgi:hypothetical protein
MDASSGQNALAFFVFAVLGAALAVVWCFLRAVRAQMREKGAFSIVLEAAFGILCAVSIKLAALGVYWGEVRAFLLFGAALGFWAVYETAGRLLSFVAGIILHAVVRWILRPLGRFVCRLGRLAQKGLLAAANIVRKVTLWVKYALKSAGRFVYNKKNAKKAARRRTFAGHGVVKPHAQNKHTKKAAQKAQSAAGGGTGNVLCVYARGRCQSADADTQPESQAAEHSVGNSGTGNQKQRRSPRVGRPGRQQ